MMLARLSPALLLFVAPVAANAAPAQLDVTTAPTTGAKDSGLRMISPALRCSDADRSLRFYTQGLGMIERGRVNLKEITEIILGFSTAPDEPGIMLIKRKDDTPATKIEHGNGYQRIVLRVPELKAVADRLTAAGYAAEPIRSSGPYRILFVQDPDGYRYELVEYPKEANNG